MTDTEKKQAKSAAARVAAALVEPGMTVGLGTGSTASLFVEALGERVRGDALSIRGVPTSRAAGELARQRGIEVVPLGRNTRPDLTVDGADEVDPALHLIKGGGGALVEEKIVAASSRRFVVVSDPGKQVGALGAFPLPVAVVPFGWETTLERLEAAFGVPAVLRARDDGTPVVTDDGLHLIDLRFGAIPDPAGLEGDIKRLVGVVEVGLFVGLAASVLVGHPDGRVEERTRP